MKITQIAEVAIVAACVAMLAAAPVALAGKGVAFVLWTALGAAAAYVKGKLEPAPGGTNGPD